MVSLVSRRRRALLLGAVSATAILVACVPYVRQGSTALQPAPVVSKGVTSPGANAPAAPQPLTLHETATEFAFDQPAIKAEVGQRVTLSLNNSGKLAHNLTVDATSTQITVKPGETASGEVTFDKPGTYDFYCSIPGHKDAGMHGSVTVGDPAAAAPTDAHVSHDTQAATLTSDDAVLPVPEGTTRLPQPQVAPPVNREAPALVKVDLETREVTALLADGVAYRFWTFNGTVPGPMIRVRQGDSVELTLRNSPDMPVAHSINLHAVNGPGGGSVDTQIEPGEQSTIRFTALHPGVYVYHCMTPVVGQHVANGMYGMIVVEPPEGLPRVDREFYMMQGDFYLQGNHDDKGLRSQSLDKLWQEMPDFVVFNGSQGSLTGVNALRARVGETVRFFFGVGGPNKDSAFHVVGESFDTVHPEGASETLTNVQTTLVPPGDATMVEMKLDVPGHYMIEDHHVGRLEKGAMADLEIDGDPQPDIFTHLPQSDTP